MKVALHNRIKRLEERSGRSLSVVWHRILLEEGEAETEAIARYIAAGNVVDGSDNFIFRLSVPVVSQAREPCPND
jgi:hypothetical protein